jgi:hypothetical protein
MIILLAVPVIFVTLMHAMKLPDPLFIPVNKSLRNFNYRDETGDKSTA